MKIAIKTSDRYLYQKIFLILGKSHELFPYASEKDKYDLLLSDEPSDSRAGVIIMGRQNDAKLSVPFTESELTDAITGKTEGGESISIGERCVFFKGKKIPLTELEFSLFRLLYEARGEFVEREILHKKVFGENYTSGVLNVYVHYLREKLETEDEKIIISSRKQGYKINERYF